MITVPRERSPEAIRIPEPIDFSVLAKYIASFAEGVGLDVVVQLDTLAIAGGVRNLLSMANPDPCVVVYHAKHMRDYYAYALTQQQQGKMVTCYFHMVGFSKNYGRKVDSEMFHGILRQIVMPDQRKHQEEYAYYDYIKQVIADSLSQYFADLGYK